MSHHTTERSSKRFRNLRRAIACLSLGMACAASFHAMAAPYSGTPISLPATFEAENFDKGGEGIGYHELTPGNAGDASLGAGRSLARSPACRTLRAPDSTAAP